MGRSDPYLNNFYKKNIHPKGTTALLGFVQQGKFGLHGDLYDYQLNNWEINSDWKLPKKYDTIVSLRCPYFAKNPEKFIENCFKNIKDDGLLFVDWGYGHHFGKSQGFDFKVGWVKNGVHEYEYSDDNFLWSGLWHDSFLKNPEFIKFSNSIKKFGYNENIKEVIFKETPSVVKLEKLNKKYDIIYNIITLWDNSIEGLNSPAHDFALLPQCYILLMMRKKK
tara:strand:+ start:408 stop:1073 length:666 start_codon:yes stop_codon:yes gene_type:complete